MVEKMLYCFYFFQGKYLALDPDRSVLNSQMVFESEILGTSVKLCDLLAKSAFLPSSCDKRGKVFEMNNISPSQFSKDLCVMDYHFVQLPQDHRRTRNVRSSLMPQQLQKTQLKTLIASMLVVYFILLLYEYCIPKVLHVNGHRQCESSRGAEL